MGLKSNLREGLGRITGQGTTADLVRSSGLVDEDWYRTAYGDLDEGVDAVQDYLRNGVSLGRDPNPMFETAWYLDRYPDVREAGINPLVHYLTDGAGEGRDPGPAFSTSYYLSANPEVADEGMNPLSHYIGFGREEGRRPLPDPKERLDEYEAAVRTRRSVTGAAAIDHVHFPLQRPRRRYDPAAGLPLPPLPLAQRIGAPNLDEFEEIGRGTRRTIQRCLPPGFDFKGKRVLDFGCGVGRVLRYFAEEAGQGEFWGCELDGPSTRWNVENLSPPFRFFQISEIPTIPLESESFDLVYAISVFAHIHVDWHHWMMEIRRILKPGGYAFVTFMAQTPHDEMLGESYWGRGETFGKFVQNPFADWNDGGPMAFHHPDWVSAYWGGLFDIEFIGLDGLLEYQSICLMRKPQPGAPIRTQCPVYDRSGSQAFDKDAVGRISEKHDLDRGFLDSYGVELALARPVAGGDAQIDGWIVFRGDTPAGLDLSVDGRPVESRTSFKAGGPYRDWSGTLRHGFSVRAPLDGLPPGEHRLEALVRSAAGRTHGLSIPLLVR